MRSNEKELLDLGPHYYTDKEYDDCLKKLGLIGKFLGGDRASLKAFQKLDNPPKSILDIGCGGGAFTALLAKKFPQAHVLGIDLNEKAIEYAKKYNQRENLLFLVQKEKKLTYPKDSFDVVTATLVCHHMDDQELERFLKDVICIAKEAIIINDLHRHVLASLCYKVVAPIFFNNRLIIHDGLLSIKRAFKRNDWLKILKKLPVSYSLKWYFPFRWILVLKKND